MYKVNFRPTPLKDPEPDLEDDRSYVVIGFILCSVSGFVAGLLAHWLF